MNRGTNADLVEELFPEKSSSSMNAQWTNDFLRLMNFWTGSLAPNPCILVDDQSPNLNFETNPAGAELNHCGYQYVSGGL